MNRQLWYLGAMNDACWIIDQPPSPANTDVPPHNSGPDVNVISGPFVTREEEKIAREIIAAHNACLQS